MTYYNKPATRRLGTLPFMMLWISGHIASWGTLFYLWGMNVVSDFVFMLLSGLVLGVGIGFVQKLLMRFAYNINISGWLRLTTLGWVGGWLSYFILSEAIPGYYAYPFWLYILPIFIFPALLQWVLIRQHVRSAWLWLLAAIVSTMTFGLVLKDAGYDVTSHIVSGIAQGTVTGLSFAWLFDRQQQSQQNQSRQTSQHMPSYSAAYDDHYYDDEEYYEEEQHKHSHLIQG